MTDQELFEYVWVPAFAYLCGSFNDISQLNQDAREIYKTLIANVGPNAAEAAKRVKNILTQDNKGTFLVDLTGLKNNRTLGDDINILASCIDGQPSSGYLDITIAGSNGTYHLNVNTYDSICTFIFNCLHATGNFIILDDICKTIYEARGVIDAAINGTRFAAMNLVRLSTGKVIKTQSDLPDDLFDDTGLLNKSALNSKPSQSTTATQTNKTASNTGAASSWKSRGPRSKWVNNFANNGTKEDLQIFEVYFLAMTPKNGQKPNRNTNRLNIRPLNTSGLTSSTPEKLYLNSARDYNCCTCFIKDPLAHPIATDTLLDFCSKKFGIDKSLLGLWKVKPKAGGYFALTTEAGVDVYIEASCLNEALKKQNITENIDFIESIVDSNDSDWVDYVQTTID